MKEQDICSAKDGKQARTRTELGLMIKKGMIEKSMSMRELSRHTGICTATVSRIVNNKQAPNFGHVKRLSEFLEIPLETLLRAAGMDVKEIDSDSFFVLELIRDMLAAAGIELKELMNDIRRELKKYEQYAKTDDGRKIILTQCPSKLEQTGEPGILSTQLKSFYELFCSNSVEAAAQALAGSALLYFCLAPDVISDNLFAIGYIDDAIAIRLVTERLFEEFGIYLQ